MTQLCGHKYKATREHACAITQSAPHLRKLTPSRLGTEPRPERHRAAQNRQPWAAPSRREARAPTL